MKEIGFINGKTKIKIKNDNLSAYLERIEAADYVAIKEIYKQFPQVYRLLFNHGEIIEYILQDYEIV